jgi:hypothetical protein
MTPSSEIDYAILCGDELMIICKAASLARAVEIKTWYQAGYNQLNGCDEIFHVRKATRA